MDFMEYALLTLLATISPFFGVAEPLAVLCGLTGSVSWFWVGLSLGLGQTFCFIVLCRLGDETLARFPWLEKKTQKIDFERFRKNASVYITSAAMLGLPPVTVLAASSRVLIPSLVQFLGITFVGRVIRFWLLAGLPAIFGQWFQPESLPDFIRVFFD